MPQAPRTVDLDCNNRRVLATSAARLGGDSIRPREGASFDRDRNVHVLSSCPAVGALLIIEARTQQLPLRTTVTLPD